MAVVCGDDNQGFTQIYLVHRSAHSAGQFNGIKESAKRVGGMVGVINPSRLNLKEEAFVVSAQNVYRFSRHLTQAGFAGLINRAIVVVLHM